MEVGFENALWMLKKRQYKNPVSCVCILSDGDDSDACAENKI